MQQTDYLHFMSLYLPTYLPHKLFADRLLHVQEHLYPQNTRIYVYMLMKQECIVCILGPFELIQNVHKFQIDISAFFGIE